MLLAVDAGNTNIVLGLCAAQGVPNRSRADWIGHWRVSTDRARTQDEYAVLLDGLLRRVGRDTSDLTGVAISNVVPSIARTLERFAGEVCPHGDTLIVGWDTPGGIPVEYSPPQDVGPDRIVNAAAAHHFFGGPAIVVDYGTATTFDALSAEGTYLGGAIAPGIGISVDALAQHAARLSRIELKSPSAAIGRSTVESMRSGILLGYADQANGMIERFREELGGDPAVIATGGLAEMVAAHCPAIRHVDPWLTLEGLRLLWTRNFPLPSNEATAR